MHSLTSLHTFGLHTAAREFMTIDSLDSLIDNVTLLRNSAHIFLGEGSNTIFTENYDGLIVKNLLKGIHINEDDDYFHLNVASGENWHELVVRCMQQQIYGFENLALIPGTVGASPIQNIGAYGVEIERFVQSVEFLDLKTGMLGHFNAKECEFAYRDSRFKREPGIRVITSVNFAIPKRNIVVANYGPLAVLDAPTPEQIFDTVIHTRQSKLPDPSVLGNAGSFFKNPTVEAAQFALLQKQHPDIVHYSAPEGRVKIPAAWLIDQLGFKGKRLGGIGCHEHQALVLVNYGNGTGDELISLARDITQQVYDRYHILLEHEVRLIDKHGPMQL